MEIAIGAKRHAIELRGCSNFWKNKWICTSCAILWRSLNDCILRRLRSPFMFHSLD
jgi:hypothetical protein